MTDRSTLDRFHEKVNRTGPDECWHWKAFVMDDSGYGQFHDGTRLVRAHRFAYEATYGPIAAGLVVDHTCHNNSDCRDVPCLHRRCCNPSHLEAVTQSINSIRGRSGDHQSEKTHCKAGHEYSPANTIIRRGGRARACRTCNKAYQCSYNAKRKLRKVPHGE